MLHYFLHLILFLLACIAFFFAAHIFKTLYFNSRGLEFSSLVWKTELARNLIHQSIERSYLSFSFPARPCDASGCDNNSASQALYIILFIKKCFENVFCWFCCGLKVQAGGGGRKHEIFSDKKLRRFIEYKDN